MPEVIFSYCFFKSSLNAHVRAGRFKVFISMYLVIYINNINPIPIGSYFLFVIHR